MSRKNQAMVRVEEKMITHAPIPTKTKILAILHIIAGTLLFVFFLLLLFITFFALIVGPLGVAFFAPLVAILYFLFSVFSFRVAHDLLKLRKVEKSLFVNLLIGVLLGVAWIIIIASISAIPPLPFILNLIIFLIFVILPLSPTIFTIWHIHGIKPILEKMKILKTKPGETIMIGDWVERDVEGAKRLGMKTIFARYGDEFDTKHSGAEYDIDDIQQIVDIIQKENKS